MKSGGFLFLLCDDFSIYFVSHVSPPLEKGTEGYNHDKIPNLPGCVSINTSSFLSATSIGRNKLRFPSGYVFQTQRIGRGCRISLTETVNGSKRHVTDKLSELIYMIVVYKLFGSSILLNKL
jgi:hypothetical protein